MKTIEEAAHRLLTLERRFGIERDVESGLYALHVLPLREVTAAWALGLLKLPSTVLEEVRFAPATMSTVRGRLLADESFGQRSEDDSAWFDPTPEGTQGLADRDAALATFLRELGAPLELAVLFDHAQPKNDRCPWELSVLRTPRAVALLARTTDAAQLDTRANAQLFR